MSHALGPRSCTCSTYTRIRRRAAVVHVPSWEDGVTVLNRQGRELVPTLRCFFCFPALRALAIDLGRREHHHFAKNARRCAARHRPSDGGRCNAPCACTSCRCSDIPHGAVDVACILERLLMPSPHCGAYSELLYVCACRKQYVTHCSAGQHKLGSKSRSTLRVE